MEKRMTVKETLIINTTIPTRPVIEFIKHDTAEDLKRIVERRMRYPSEWRRMDTNERITDLVYCIKPGYDEVRETN